MRDPRFAIYMQLLLSIPGGVTFGCDAEACRMVLDGFPLEFGELKCHVTEGARAHSYYSS